MQKVRPTPRHIITPTHVECLTMLLLHSETNTASELPFSQQPVASTAAVTIAAAGCG
jgi:hypothetical protein